MNASLSWARLVKPVTCLAVSWKWLFLFLAEVKILSPSYPKKALRPTYLHIQCIPFTLSCKLKQKEYEGDYSFPLWDLRGRKYEDYNSYGWCDCMLFDMQVLTFQKNVVLLSLKCWYLFPELHTVAFKKIVIVIHLHLSLRCKLWRCLPPWHLHAFILLSYGDKFVISLPIQVLQNVVLISVLFTFEGICQI